MTFVKTPKLAPESFGTQAFYGVNAFKFTNEQGKISYGRYRIEPNLVRNFFQLIPLN